MQMAVTLIAVVAGLVLSLAVALVAEELIFGQVMRMFFFRRIENGTKGIAAKGNRCE